MTHDRQLIQENNCGCDLPGCTQVTLPEESLFDGCNYNSHRETGNSDLKPQ